MVTIGMLKKAIAGLADDVVVLIGECPRLHTPELYGSALVADPGTGKPITCFALALRGGEDNADSANEEAVDLFAPETGGEG